MLYDKPENKNFQNKLEKVPYKAFLAITGAIQGTSKQNISHELGLHTLIERRWCSKLTFFHEIVNGLLLEYLFFIFEIPFTRELPFKFSINY